MRYPTTPLVVHDPYFSIWCFRDKAFEGRTNHWTGKSNAFFGLIHIDGKCYSFLGDYHSCPFVTQKSVKVTPTRTIYVFEVDGVELTMTFLTPALPHKLTVMARPVTYIIFDLKSIDGKDHKANIMFEHTGDICVDNQGDMVDWGRLRHPRLELLHVTPCEQRVLEHRGDDLRIEWGRSFIARPVCFKGEGAFGRTFAMRKYFVDNAVLPPEDYTDLPCGANQAPLTAAESLLFDVKAGKQESAYLVSAYLDGWSIEYFHHRLKGYWTKAHATFNDMLTCAVDEFETLKEECEKYDEELTSDLTRLCGEKFAEVCALAFRQAIGAHKLVANENGEPLFFSKENFSNGCIATVDVTYPSSPLFLLTNKLLVRGMMTPIFEYAAMPDWKYDFAPHDIGTYPLANGQVYRGGEYNFDEQMPIEECGNMLILAGTLLKFHNDIEYLEKYRDLLSLWAEYLVNYGYDPENQLCTDDFAGHLAHNANLSIKAIIALGAWSQITAALGDKSTSERFRAEAEKAAKMWQQAAFDQDHYRLAFDQPNTWSQKYNLVWDKLLGLNLFPEEVAQTEVKWYLKHQNKYGLPLDSRKSYTKLDWIAWSATLSGKKEDFLALTDPLYTYCDETPSRVPMCDWYETTNAEKVGFQARSVVGGLFIPLLYDADICRKYAAKIVPDCQ